MNINVPYIPDMFVVLEIVTEDDVLYKVFGTWVSHSYTSSDTWRMNSGVVSVEKDKDAYRFYSSSGSCYLCYTDSYGTSMYTGDVLSRFIKDAEKHGVTVKILDDTDWSKFNFNKR